MPGFVMIIAVWVGAIVVLITIVSAVNRARSRDPRATDQDSYDSSGNTQSRANAAASSRSMSMYASSAMS